MATREPPGELASPTIDRGDKVPQESLFVNRRFALRSMPSLDKVEQFASALGWPRESDVQSDRKRKVPRHVAWFASPRLNLHYVEDLLTPQCCARLSGYRDDVDHAAGLLVKHLNPWTDQELLTAVDVAADPIHRAHAVILLAMGAPEEFHEGYFERISNSLMDEDEWVREAAIWAIQYCSYSNLLRSVSEIADDDPSEYLRQAAQEVLRAIDAANAEES